uniref:Uncharacterized protein n=1 Tax=Esox lucius TaxID=8010 RepID=A0A3P8ZUW1_ESOLU
MNTTSDPAVNISSTTITEPPIPSNVSIFFAPSHVPSVPHDPRLTILVVLGLSLLLAGCAIFLAVCRRSASQAEGDSDGGCGSGEYLICGPSLSSEPQLKLWKRLGSVRRSFTSSFRRPPQRRPEYGNHDQSHDCHIASSLVLMLSDTSKCQYKT